MKKKILFTIAIISIVLAYFFPKSSIDVKTLQSGSLEEIKKLINKENVNEPIGYCSPLHWSIIGSNIDGINYIITTGANLEAYCAYDENLKGSPLNFAAYYGNLEVVKILINKGAQFNINQTKNNTIKKENIDQNPLFSSPIYLAIIKGHTEIVKFLLNLNPPNIDKKVLLEYAQKSKNSILIDYIQYYLKNRP